MVLMFLISYWIINQKINYSRQIIPTIMQTYVLRYFYIVCVQVYSNAVNAI